MQHLNLNQNVLAKRHQCKHDASESRTDACTYCQVLLSLNLSNTMNVVIDKQQVSYARRGRGRRRRRRIEASQCGQRSSKFINLFVTLVTFLVPFLLMNKFTTCYHQSHASPAIDLVHNSRASVQMPTTMHLKSYTNDQLDERPAQHKTSDSFVFHTADTSSVDWAKRLAASERPDGAFERQVKVQTQQQQLLNNSDERLAARPLNNYQIQQPVAPGTSLLKSLINNTISLVQQQQQHSHLGRALEVTKMFIKQQQQQQQQQQSMASYLPRTPLLSHSLVGTTTESLRQLPNSMSNKLYNFLQSRLQNQLDASQARKVGAADKLQQHQQQEPLLQSATSDHRQRQTFISQPSSQVINEDEQDRRHSQKSTRSLVTLSAPYEQRVRSVDDHSSSANLLLSASGTHPTTTNASLTPAIHDDRDSWSTASGQEQQQQVALDADSNSLSSANEMMSNETNIPEQQQVDAGQTVYELHDEQAQRQQQTSDTNAQLVPNDAQTWNATANQMDDGQTLVEHDHRSQQVYISDSPSALSSAYLDNENNATSTTHQASDEQEENNSAAQLSGLNPTSSQDQDWGLGQLESGSILPYEEPVDVNKTTEEVRHNQLSLNNHTQVDLMPAKSGEQVTSNNNNMQSDESFLAAQLPSQYESVMRAPPDGHYDDYFKPLGGATDNSQGGGTTNMLTSGRAALIDNQANHGHQVDSSNGGQSFAVTDTDNNSSTTGTNQSAAEMNGSLLMQSLMNTNTTVDDQRRLLNQSNQRVPSYHINASNESSNKSGADYTVRYYMNQQPLKQSQASQDQSVEFMSSNNNSKLNEESMLARQQHSWRNTSTGQNSKNGEPRMPKTLIGYLVKNPTDGVPSDAVSQHRTRPSMSNDDAQPPAGSGNHQQVFLVAKDLSLFDNQTRAALVQQLNNNNSTSGTNLALAQQHNSSGETDQIQLIVANSNESHDPNTNERFITYTSEVGQNFSRPAAKPARHTFYNKDLNELPLSSPQMEEKKQEHSLEEHLNVTTRTPFEGTQRVNQSQYEPILSIVRYRSTRSPNLSLGAQTSEQDVEQQVAEVSSNSNKQRLPRKMVVATTTTTPSHLTDNSSTDRSDDYSESSTATEESMAMNAEDDNAEGAPPTLESSDTGETDLDGLQLDHYGQFGMYNSGRKRAVANKRVNEKKSSRMPPVTSGNNGHSTRSNHQHQARSKRPTTQTTDNAPKTGGQAARASKTLNNGHKQQQQSNFRTAHKAKASMVKQQTIRRPQVTEAKFELKDLPLNAPTPMPSMGDLTTKTFTELPVKVKRLRDNQADKNELMNELLTALDRVKSAIYKLQPLTAKMNALYRKSVTSNTRDQILDANKGTYSKRYPPGDYDDTYDRMHPSEVLDRTRDRSSSSSSVEQQQQQRRQRRRRREDERFQAGESKASAVYLPAPSELLEQLTGGKQSVQKRFGTQQEVASTVQFDASPKIVATGIGRRVGGKLHSRLSLSSSTGGQIVYDDEVDDDEQYVDALSSLTKRAGTSLSSPPPQPSPSLNSTGNATVERDLDDRDVQSPLFGYRITIYQSPSDESNDATTQNNDDHDDEDEKNRLLTYSLISNGANAEESEESMDVPTIYREPDDLLATSESSLMPLQNSLHLNANETLDESASSMKKKKEFDMKKKEKKRKKMMEEEEKHKKRHKQEKGDKKKEKWAKHQQRGKKGEEEHKKKKEFKKIKHSKGVMSKESHKLHRDKHIKAHDRGAAKEKALKERTQIEFFEREQIVDDEFEKGKKSTMKAGWSSGHEAKKSKHEHGGGGGGDHLSMGGSHFVNHMASPSTPVPSVQQPPMLMTAASEHGDHKYGASHVEKGHGHSSESSSGKQSNKFEKKHMEAKGKKFKGWREKGYKIITETEFIDRGSLHDSAYKKRDKGAAHHQKMKKHEAKSEGHHGSMHEHHKKSHKKEEKKSKMEEKKKEMMGKEEGEKAQKHKKANKKEMADKKAKKHEKEQGTDHDEEESTLTITTLSSLPTNELMYETPASYDTINWRSNNSTNIVRTTPEQYTPIFHTQITPKPASHMTTTTTTAPMTSTTSLARLLNADYHQLYQNNPHHRMSAKNNSSPSDSINHLYRALSRPTTSENMTSAEMNTNRRSDNGAISAEQKEQKLVGDRKSSPNRYPLVEMINRLNLIDSSKLSNSSTKLNQLSTLRFVQNNPLKHNVLAEANSANRNTGPVILGESAKSIGTTSTPATSNRPSSSEQLRLFQNDFDQLKGPLNQQSNTNHYLQTSTGVNNNLFEPQKSPAYNNLDNSSPYELTESANHNLSPKNLIEYARLLSSNSHLNPADQFFATAQPALSSIHQLQDRLQPSIINLENTVPYNHPFETSQYNSIDYELTPDQLLSAVSLSRQQQPLSSSSPPISITHQVSHHYPHFASTNYMAEFT